MRWTIAQQRKYRAQVRELGLDDAARRELLRLLTGKTSTSELDSEEMALVIREQAKRLGHRATQDDKIHGLEKVLGWYGQPARLNGFIRRQTHGRKRDLASLTPREKSALIEALKGVHKHQRRRRNPSTRPRRAVRRRSSGSGGYSCTDMGSRGRQKTFYF